MKRLLSVFFAVTLIMALVPNAAFAISNPASSTLTIEMKYDGAPLSGFGVAICRVAILEKDDGGEIVFALTPAFEATRSPISTLELETNAGNLRLASIMESHAALFRVTRIAENTDAQGLVRFTDLPPGLYLVSQADPDSEYIIDPYLLIVHKQQEPLTMDPKATLRMKAPVTEVSVMKVWAGTTSHPASITVQLYKNGAAFGSIVTLNAANFWSYTWKNLDDPNATWTVDEINVPPGFTKVITGSASTQFIITNNVEVPTTQPPGPSATPPPSTRPSGTPGPSYTPPSIPPSATPRPSFPAPSQPIPSAPITRIPTPGPYNPANPTPIIPPRNPSPGPKMGDINLSVLAAILLASAGGIALAVYKRRKNQTSL